MRLTKRKRKILALFKDGVFLQEASGYPPYTANDVAWILDDLVSSMDDLDATLKAMAEDGLLIEEKITHGTTCWRPSVDAYWLAEGYEETRPEIERLKVEEKAKRDVRQDGQSDV